MKLNSIETRPLLPHRRTAFASTRIITAAVIYASISICTASDTVQIGQEISAKRHLKDGEAPRLALPELLKQGHDLFTAMWTVQEGAGRPQSKGTGLPLSDPERPLVFPRNFNRISGPDSNSCAGCHNSPFGVSGGGGDIVTNALVLGQRFDFITFDRNDKKPTSGSVNEEGVEITFQSLGNFRSTLGMYGSGYIEMLARQMTADLQKIRDMIKPGQARRLKSKGVSFGILGRYKDGFWDTSRTEGIPPAALASSDPDDPPDLVIRPFHQSGSVISLREFTNNAFNHHHGIQSSERFGKNVDEDQDGFANELTRGDITAVSVYQAVMAVPGQVIPNHPEIEAAIQLGNKKFTEIGCTACHLPTLPLDNKGWIFSEPNPYNFYGNLRPGEAEEISINLNDPTLPSPRLKESNGIVQVPAYTDLKLHDITTGPDDPNAEPLDMNDTFVQQNRRFLTKKLWGAANEPPYFHHGKFTTLRQAVLAHSGEALASRKAFETMSKIEKDSLIEFLKSLQILPPGTKSLTVDENGKAKKWPPSPSQAKN
ncbi:MAG: di-heme oxidoredictase family protein [Verrucomicrobiota bacterium]